MQISFIGAGNMASCLIQGLVQKGFAPAKIWASNPRPARLNVLQEKFNIRTTTNNIEAAEQTDVVVLAVKPIQMRAVIAQLAPTINSPKKIVISVAAMLTTTTLRTWLGSDANIIRCMPNLPVQIGQGVSVLFADSSVNAEQKRIADTIFNAVGTSVWLEDEHLMEAAMALSGCGPAYFFLLMEIIQNAAIELGLPAALAKSLSLQTAMGSVQLAVSQADDVATLRKQVTSPGGATERALNVLEAGGIRELFSNALAAAAQHANAMNDQLKNTVA